MSKTLESLSLRVANRYAASSNSSISNQVKQKVNAELIRAGMDGNRRFRSASAALSVISDVLGKNSIEWDEVLNGFLFNQDNGRTSINLAFQTEDSFSPVSIQNSSLAFHWDTLESGVEVIAYLG